MAHALLGLHGALTCCRVCRRCSLCQRHLSAWLHLARTRRASWCKCLLRPKATSMHTTTTRCNLRATYTLTRKQGSGASSEWMHCKHCVMPRCNVLCILVRRSHWTRPNCQVACIALCKAASASAWDAYGPWTRHRSSVALICISASLCSGLSQFYNKVFTHSWDTPEVYCGDFPHLGGKTFGCAELCLQRCAQACACKYVPKQGKRPCISMCAHISVSLLFAVLSPLMWRKYNDS